jgi:hypothetical protein
MTPEMRMLLIRVVKMMLATAERRSDDAIKAFTEILDSAAPAEEQARTVPWSSFNVRSSCNDDDSDIFDDLPALIPISRLPTATTAPTASAPTAAAPAVDEGNVDLVISEESCVSAATAPAPAKTVQAVQTIVMNVCTPAEEEEAATDEEEKEEEAVEEEEQEEEEQEQEAADEEEEQEQEEAADEQELDLVPVRIKKVTYWKDELTGDIYQYIADDECGDKVGTYVDGKPVFTSD